MEVRYRIGGYEPKLLEQRVLLACSGVRGARLGVV
jgi:hypothetical protein